MVYKQSNRKFTGGKWLNVVLALVTIMVAGGIAYVGWHFVDTVQKRTTDLKNMGTNSDNSQVSSHGFEVVQQLHGSEISAGSISPKLAVQEAMHSLEGSEVPADKASRAEEAGHFREAAAYYSKAIDQFPSDKKTKTIWCAGGYTFDHKEYDGFCHEERAYCYLRLGEYKKAISDLNIAVELRPRFARTNLQNRAKAYMFLGKKDLADADMKASLKLPEFKPDPADMQFP